MIEMGQNKYEGGRWKPPILKAQAVFDKGVAELLEEIEEHRSYLNKAFGGLQIRKRKENVREELVEMVKNRLVEEVLNDLTETGQFDKAVESIVEGNVDPYTACDNLVLPKLDFFVG
jgi:LAO/AO transport system kinase